MALMLGFLGLSGVVGGAMLLRMRALARRTEILRSYSRHIQEAREEERISAARDVHDEIGQHLAALNLQAYWVQTHPDAPGPLRKERMEEMLGSISDAMSAVKSVATNLRPVALDALKFDEAVTWYVRTFTHRSGMTVSLEISEGFPKVKGPLATGLFRVLQEMLTNVSRHSQASKVVIRLGFGYGFVSLEVTDDGRGIPPGKAEADDSFGIIGMRERCAAFGGRLYVRSAPGEGTQFTARVPFPQPEGRT
jgi:signal transduction histidine kinase